MWVLDASVATKWFFTDEPHRKEALKVRSLLADRPDQFFVPSLFFSEMLHVLARKSGFNHGFVENAMDLLLKLGIRGLALSDKGMSRAIYHACHGLSGYDATYLALAEDIHARWITADVDAVHKAGSKHVMKLSEFN